MPSLRGQVLPLVLGAQTVFHGDQLCRHRRHAWEAAAVSEPEAAPQLPGRDAGGPRPQQSSAGPRGARPLPAAAALSLAVPPGRTSRA